MWERRGLSRSLHEGMMKRTVNDILQEAIRANEGRPAFTGGADGAYDGLTYGGLGGMTRSLALGLRALGIRKGDRVGLISGNRPEWALADLAILHAGAVDVALFPTLPEGQVSYCLKDSGASLVIVSDEVQLQKVLPWAGGGRGWRGERGRRVIIMDPPTGAGAAPGLLTLQDVMKAGEKAAGTDFEALWRYTSPKDPAAIVYTSGTTGAPMGVVLTQGNLASSLDGAVDAVAFGPGERIVSFLPLNHVLARLSDHLLPLSVGAAIGYARSARSLRPMVREVRPHYLTLVPRVLDMFREGVLGEVSKGPPEARTAFERSFEAGLERLRILDSGAVPGPDLEAICKKGDEMIFSRIREGLGLDQLKFFVSGGAPLSMETARFFRVLGLEVIEGYGLTETAALVSVNRPGRVRPGTVGPPVKGVEVRVGDGGEILVRGGVVMEGYWDRPEDTARALVAGGWLRTGDMGEEDGEGCLRIRGRLKEIIVLSTGKNVAPMLVEERLCESPYIAQAVVVGDGRSTLSALLVPDFARVRAWLGERAAEEGAGAGPELSDEEVVNTPEVRGLIRGEIKRLSSGLAGFEQVKRFALIPRTFTPEGGELTPTMKIRRKVVLERYAGVVEGMYG